MAGKTNDVRRYDPDAGEPVSGDAAELKRVEDELKRSEESLRRQNNLFVALLKNLPLGVFMVESPSGRPLLANAAACELLGRGIMPDASKTNLAEVYKAYKKGSRDPYPPDEMPILLGMRGKAAHVDDLVVERPDGTRRLLEIFGSPVTDGQGNVWASLVSFFDITERKQAEEEQARLRDELRYAQKMEAVGRLAGGIAHDFNNMLQIILGNTELLLTSTRTDTSQARLIESIAATGRRAAELTRQLLSFARKEMITPEVLDINQAVKTMLPPLQQLVDSNVDLSWTPAAEPCVVKMDRSQLTRILTNLIINAREAITGSGRISLQAEITEYDEAYSENSPEFMPSPYVVLTVSDTGCGMDKEMIDCIFEPFFTTKPEYLGCGLGLPSLYGIVRQNNGFIKVDSQLGKGTTFRIYLPRYVAESTAPPAKNTSAGLPAGAGTILLVDDEEILLSICRDHLERLGYKVMAFTDPEEALLRARSYKGSIDLLLSDVSMPKLQGPELSRRLAVLYPQIRSIFMSGYTSDVLLHQQRIREEDRNFLEKPFPLKSLTEKVREVLAPLKAASKD